MEGPYRDLGNGFVRLTGLEGARRSPSRITSVEAALLELLRNARDAGAGNIFVASTLRRHRFRTLTVIDDGCGVPEEHAEAIFEPGVTTRHLDPTRDPENSASTPHGAGLSLYHLKNAALEARVVSPSSPTAIKVTFDTQNLPERSLQSATRPSKSNLEATLRNFLTASNQRPPDIYFGSIAAILATLLENHIIQHRRRDSDREERRRGIGASKLKEQARRLGLEVSLRTVQRVLRGKVTPAEKVWAESRSREVGGREAKKADGPVVRLEEEEASRIKAILDEVAQARYLEVGEHRIEARPGEIHFRVTFHEPEEEYE